MKTKIITTVIALIFLMPLTGRSQERKEQFQEKKKEIGIKKIGFLTEQLALTTEEAQAFWPVYNEFESQKDALLKENRDKKEPIDIDKLSEKELNEMLDAEINKEKKMLDLRIEYQDKFKKVLPVKKVVLLYKAEKEFRKVLLNDIREVRKDRKPKPLNNR